jgi:hypothetical protein
MVWYGPGSERRQEINERTWHRLREELFRRTIFVKKSVDE